MNVSEFTKFMAVNKIVGGTGAPTIHEVSGQTVSFASKVEEPLKEVTAKINPTQNLNGYDKPWAPGGGRNLLENNYQGSTTANYTLERNADGTFTLNGTVSSTTIAIANFAMSQGSTSNQNDQKKHLKNGTYFFTTNNRRTSIGLQILASNVAGTSNIATLAAATEGTVTIDDTYQYNWIRLRISAGTYTNEIIAPVVCLSTETDTSYAPYSNICPITGWTGAEIYVSPTTSATAGTTYNIVFPSGAGTVYGDTLTIHEDGSGTLTSTHALLTMDGVTAGKKFSNKSGAAIYDEYYLQVADGYTFRGSSGYVSQADANANGLICSISPYYDFTSQYRITFTAYIGAQIVLQPRLRFALGIGYDTLEKANQYLEDLNTAGTPLTFCYPLKLPTEYNLTAEQIQTLIGKNYVWANTGDVTVKYLKYGNTNADNIKIKLLTDIL